MNTKYISVTGEVIEIEVPAELEEVILEVEESQEKKNRAETRRHKSISYMEEQGFQFEDKFYDLGSAVERNNQYKTLYDAMDKLLPHQQELVRKIYFESKSLTAIAQEEGVNKSSVHKRLARIHEKLRKYLI